MKRTTFFLLLITTTLLSSYSYGDEVVPTVNIDSSDEALSPLNPYSTYKTERVSKEKFSQPHRQTLTDLVKDQVGVEAQTYCANCGAKRLTINGLKGEHTSILIDGLPLHSAVSSFYGVDSVPVNGIVQIDVMRGAGASLTNPEAIGGTLDLITVDPLVDKQLYSLSLSTDDSLGVTAQNHSALVSVAADDKKTGITIGAQYTKTNPWDEDDNGVAESPERTNYSALYKVRALVGSKNDFVLRLGISDLEILGGPVNATKPTQVRQTPAQETDFEDGNVERRFIGDPSRITDWISLKRYEAAIHWTRYISDSTTLTWNTGYARQEQDAIYQHGFDYAHNDNLFVSDLGLQWFNSSSHIYKVGLFYKLQRLKSASEVLFEDRGLPRDNFDNISNAGYMRYTYLHSEKFEMDFALRLDHVYINWLDLTNEITEFVVAPRFQLRHEISHHLSQRFSYGLGYRAPLTFFESQHGNNENGYVIDIEELEKAHSYVYSLSYNTPKYYFTFSTHYTHLQNMAFGFESQGQPILYQNSDEDFDIWASDILLGYKLTDNWMLETSFEAFQYEDGYTRRLPTAAIEERLQFKSRYETDKWEHNFVLSVIFARNLTRYGSYPDHFVDRNQFPPPERRGDEPKDQNAPTFFVIDTSWTYKLKKNYKLVFGITNLLNETQVAHKDSPSTWHWHFDHAHYDGLHTWGPNRGREYSMKFEVGF